MADQEKIKDLRITIDRVAQLVDKLQPHLTEYNIGYEVSYEKTPQILYCHKSLLLAKAWLGKLLASYGSESPYKNDGNRHSIGDIEPADARADVRSTDNTLYADRNHIEKVDYLRQYIQELCIDKVVAMPPASVNTSIGVISMLTREGSIARTNAYTHLCEARFALGFEIERIRETK